LDGLREPAFAASRRQWPRRVTPHATLPGVYSSVAYVPGAIGPSTVMVRRWMPLPGQRIA
jgi:hypothetical protein